MPIYISAEDNNTRVLFERVLSSGSLEPEKSVYVYDVKTFIILLILYYIININICYFEISFSCRDIWNRFLEFESNIGDLASIVKVEKRRSAVLEKVIINQYMIYFSIL